MFGEITPSPMALWQFVGAVALFASIAGNVASVVAAKGRKERVGIEPQPLEVRGVSPWVTEQQCGQMHKDMHRRLDEYGVEIRNLWGTMHKEDEKTRNMLVKALQDIERTLGRIEGKLENQG